jgi:hypothetical protein
MLRLHLVKGLVGAPDGIAPTNLLNPTNGFRWPHRDNGVGAVWLID